MEEVIDFDEWIKTVKIPPEEYYVTFDEVGTITGIHPGHAIFDTDLKIKVDNELAYSIYDGTETLASFKVDLVSKSLKKLSKIETTGLVKMDDVLHRVVEKRWSKIEDPDVEIQYDFNNRKLMFTANAKHRHVIWSGETLMLFLVTEYNDPNCLKKMIHLTVGDILENTVSVDIDIPEKFSIYTRRLFNKYTFEIV